MPVKVLVHHFKGLCLDKHHRFVWTTHFCFLRTSPRANLCCERRDQAAPRRGSPGMTGGARLFVWMMTRQDLLWEGQDSHSVETSSPRYPVW